ncbi:MAG: Gfo/Idh/MocA family oxidoreductase [Epulopiscium sp.]|nr:Gfo/Idh/MocA family oxidoreductase [Candidatus Epulonipiscium sp.]
MKTLNVGIIGAGSISNFHMEGYKVLPNVNVIAVCDINEERAKAYAKKHDIPHVFTDYNEMLKLEELEAVSVTTWNNGHAPISIAALNAGKHVLCEKPLAMNAQEAQQMVDAAKANDKILMVGFVRRFEEKANLLREAVESGDLGKVYYAKTGYVRKWGNPGGWFADKKRSGGGPVIDLGVHVIDLVRYITGKPKAVSVSASTFHDLGMKPNIKGLGKYFSEDHDENNPYNDVEDAATALIKFDNGMTLFFETSWVLHVKQPHNYVNLFGDKAGAQMEPELEFYEERNDYFTETKPIIQAGSDHMDNIFVREIKHFVECVLEGIPCRNPGEDGVEIMKILDAIYESAETGKEVIIK